MISTGCPSKVHHDNKEYVDKLQYLIDRPKSIAPIHKMNELEALLLILQNIPNDFSIMHIAAHQDNHTKYSDLSVNAQLNADADCHAEKNITSTQSTPGISTICIVYEWKISTC